MKSVNYSKILNDNELYKARFLILVIFFFLISFNVWGQGSGCVNGPTVNLSFTSGSTCGMAPVKISGTFGGSATSVTIAENGRFNIFDTI
jgi:hypothetical protein